MALTVVLMFLVDEIEIGWMPARGTASLWPLRLLTDFGKSSYVLTFLAFLLVVIIALAPRLTGAHYAGLTRLAGRVHYLFFAVLLPVLVGELLKGAIGRGRPFVGGPANAFNYSHFSWAEAYASFPSGHATASCALAFAVSALWPRLKVVMAAYAAAILISRLVLLAHHPSDVVGGALLGILGAALVRYWFAARRAVFLIRPDGRIVARERSMIRGSLRAMRAALSR